MDLPSPEGKVDSVLGTEDGWGETVDQRAGSEEVLSLPHPDLASLGHPSLIEGKKSPLAEGRKPKAE